MTNMTRLISSPEELTLLAGILEKEEIIALDTEFIRESTFFPTIELIQIATEAESWVLDARAFKKNHRPHDPSDFSPGLEPILNLLKNPKILKVLHASQADQECLYTSFGVLASPSLDTAIAASLCGYGEGLGLGFLLKQILGVSIVKGHARTHWAIRPLPAQLIEYAHADVQHLVRLGKNLLAELERLGRKQWALDLSARWEKPNLYQMDVQGIVSKLMQGRRLDPRISKVLAQLVEWRETRARELNLPRRWVADDQVLCNLAQVRPKDLTHLSTFRGLNRGELKQSGELLIAICQTPELSSEVQEQPETLTETSVVPKIPVQPEETHALALLQCYLEILAHRHHIAARHLLTTDRLLEFLRNPTRSPDEWVKLGLLSTEAAHLIGDELSIFLQGEHALLLINQQATILPVASLKKT